MKRWRPLRGVRVLAFEAAFSLPSGTRILADLGAEVVRVGRPGGEYGTYIGVIDGIGLNKRSITIDLRLPEGQEVARRLVSCADVVCNNFTPRVMKQYGLDPDSLRAIKPDVILLQLSGYGSPGPWQDFQAFGPSTEAAGGMNALTGGPEDPPMRVGSGVFADQAAGRYAALALIAALEHRRVTGEGRTLDLSMTECTVQLLGEHLLYAARTGKLPARTGNRDPECAPQGIYPCHVPNSWLALSVQTDEQWRALYDVMADSKLSGAEYDSAERRLANQDGIDGAIAAWTSRQARDNAVSALQARGIPAGPVQQVSDLPFDVQLQARGAFQWVQHEQPLLGHTAHPHLTLAWEVEGHPRPALADERPGGSDNRLVLRRWLGMPAREVQRLERSGALLPLHRTTVGVPPNQVSGNVETDFAVRLGLPVGDDESDVRSAAESTRPA